MTTTTIVCFRAKATGSLEPTFAYATAALRLRSDRDAGWRELEAISPNGVITLKRLFR